MLLSQKYKVLYIANPKTATTAVQRWLMAEDDSFQKSSHIIDGRKIMLSEHITALEARTILGDSYFNKLQTLVFVREPYSKMRSAYRFYRQKGHDRSWWNTKTRSFRTKVKNLLQYALANILPFSLWALVYPFRDNFRYCLDENHQIIVTHIGRFEYLMEDLESIIKELELNLDFSKIQMVNKSKVVKSLEISNALAYLLKLRHPNLAKDLVFYEEISKRFEF